MSISPQDVEAFDRCISTGGVAIFPADTVYGLATEPHSHDGVKRLYELKGRAPDAPAAVMFFSIGRALNALPELGERTRSALERLLPGPVTLLVPNPAERFPLACGPEPERLGVRVPELTGELEALAAVDWAVLQSSANRSGGPDARRLDDVPAEIRDGVEVALDGGELPGTPSTVVDLTAYDDDGEFTIVREGALAFEAVDAALRM